MLDSYLKGHEDDWRRLKVKAQIKQEMEDYAAAVQAYEDLIPKIDKSRDMDASAKGLTRTKPAICLRARTSSGSRKARRPNSTRCSIAISRATKTTGRD